MVMLWYHSYESMPSHGVVGVPGGAAIDCGQWQLDGWQAGTLPGKLMLAISMNKQHQRTNTNEQRMIGIPVPMDECCHCAANFTAGAGALMSDVLQTGWLVMDLFLGTCWCKDVMGRCGCFCGCDCSILSARVCAGMECGETHTRTGIKARRYSELR